MVMPHHQNNAIIPRGEKIIMSLVAFDTLEFVKDLEEAGFEPKMAEAQAKAQVKILSNLIDRQVATKQDIQELKTDINNVNIRIDKLDTKIDQLDAKFTGEIKNLDARVTGEIKNLDAKFTNELEKLDSKFESKFDRLEVKIDSLGQKLTMKLGKWMVASVGLLAAMIAISHFI